MLCWRAKDKAESFAINSGRFRLPLIAVAIIDVALFGSGSLAEWIFLMLDPGRVTVTHCFDNIQQGKYFNGLTTEVPIYIEGIKVIIASSYEVPAICSQLSDLGYSSADIFCFEEQ